MESSFHLVELAQNSSEPSSFESRVFWLELITRTKKDKEDRTNMDSPKPRYLTIDRDCGAL